MKKIKVHTFKFQIVLLFLLMSLPAMGLALTASYVVTRDAQRQIIEAKQNNMELLIRQYDTGMESAKNYMEMLLFQDSSYVGLRFEETSTNYQQARVWLKDDLDRIQDYFPIISGFYVRVLHNNDCYMSKKQFQIDLDAQEFLQETIVERVDEPKPFIQAYGEQNYLIYGYKNSFVEIGFLVDLEDLEGVFHSCMADGEVLGIELQHNSEIILLNDGNTEKKHVIQEKFSSMDMSLLLYYAPLTGTSGLSLWQRLLFFASLTLLLLIPIFWLLVNRWFLRPMKQISAAMQEILHGNIEYRISEFSGIQEFSKIEQAFNRVLNYCRDLKIKVYEHEIAIEKEKLVNLKLQINPHLLLNSLNTIYSLAVNQKTAEIQDFSINLSKYFRYSLRNTAELVTIRSEIDFIKAYSRIQKIRYPNAFYIVYDVEEEIMEERIPPLIIQNFVENSTKYALKPDTEIEILVIVRKEADKLRLSICDNGRGMEEEWKRKCLERIEQGKPIVDSRGEHVGILNCVHRLHTIYGDAAQVQINSEQGVGTQVWIELPCSAEGGSAE